MTIPKFGKYACVHDSVEWEAQGFELRATIHHDADTTPDSDEGMSAEDRKAWDRDEWHYCGLVLSVSRAGIVLDDHAASLWGIDLNFPGSDNSYLTEVCAQLQDEAVVAGRAALRKLGDLANAELLAALESVLTGFLDRGAGYPDRDLHKTPAEIESEARAAIAKAKP